jgi:hypothetical protein
MPSHVYFGGMRETRNAGLRNRLGPLPGDSGPGLAVSSTVALVGDTVSDGSAEGGPCPVSVLRAGSLGTDVAATVGSAALEDPVGGAASAHPAISGATRRATINPAVATVPRGYG